MSTDYILYTTTSVIKQLFLLNHFYCFIWAKKSCNWMWIMGVTIYYIHYTNIMILNKILTNKEYFRML